MTIADVVYNVCLTDIPVNRITDKMQNPVDCDRYDLDRIYVYTVVISFTKAFFAVNRAPS